jgi:hypothetical protein
LTPVLSCAWFVLYSLGRQAGMHLATSIAGMGSRRRTLVAAWQNP